MPSSGTQSTLYAACREKWLCHSGWPFIFVCPYSRGSLRSSMRPLKQEWCASGVSTLSSTPAVLKELLTRERAQRSLSIGYMDRNHASLSPAALSIYLPYTEPDFSLGFTGRSAVAPLRKPKSTSRDVFQPHQSYSHEKALLGGLPCSETARIWRLRILQ